MAAKLAQVLCEKAELLDEYFAIRIDKDGRLLTLPVLLDKYLPDFTGLPMFLLRLATEVGRLKCRVMLLFCPPWALPWPGCCLCTTMSAHSDLLPL